jgi:hypothetical protein
MGLTAAQREIIDRTYVERMVRRRQLVERRVEASNRADDLVQDGIYDEDVLIQTQAAADAATEERALSLVLNDEIAGLLSPEQRQKLAVIVPGQLVD